MSRYGKNGGSGLRYGSGAYRPSGGCNLTQRDPRYTLARRLAEALDPTSAPGKVRTLADMTPEEQRALRERYEKPPKK